MTTGLYVTIVYGSSHLLIVMLVAFSLFYISYKAGESFRCKDFVHRLWKMRGIYTPLIIHIYDTATDIGVLYEWYKLAQREKNGKDIETLDMELMFWVAMGFMIAYRSILGLGGFLAGSAMIHDFVRDCVGVKKLPGILHFILSVVGGIIGFTGGALELGLFVAIFLEQKISLEKYHEDLAQLKQLIQQRNAASENENDPENGTVNKKGHELKQLPVQCAGEFQKMFQLFEAVLESLPEVVLQTVFIIRSVNDDWLAKQESGDGGNVLILIVISIIASLISITNKYVWIDEWMVTWQCTSVIRRSWKSPKRFVDIMKLTPVGNIYSNLFSGTNIKREPANYYKFARHALYWIMIDYIDKHGKKLTLEHKRNRCFEINWKTVELTRDVIARAEKSSQIDANEEVKRGASITDYCQKEINDPKYMDNINDVFEQVITAYLEDTWMCPLKCACEESNDKTPVNNVHDDKIYYWSYGFVIRVLWRLSAVTARFVIFSLLWVVVGGWVEFFVLIIDIYVWSACICLYSGIMAVISDASGLSTKSKCIFGVAVVVGSIFIPIGALEVFMFGWYFFVKTAPEEEMELSCFDVVCLLFCVPVASLIFMLVGLTGVMTLQLGILVVTGKWLYIVRMIENVVFMFLITWFASNPNIDCQYCVDAEERSIFNNDRIFIWIVIGWASIVVHIMTSYFVSQMIKKGYEWTWGWFIQECVEMAGHCMHDFQRDLL